MTQMKYSLFHSNLLGFPSSCPTFDYCANHGVRSTSNRRYIRGQKEHPWSSSEKKTIPGLQTTSSYGTCCTSRLLVQYNVDVGPFFQRSLFLFLIKVFFSEKRPCSSLRIHAGLLLVYLCASRTRYFVFVPVESFTCTPRARNAFLSSKDVNEERAREQSISFTQMGIHLSDEEP
jgi:hypothetical protein